MREGLYVEQWEIIDGVIHRDIKQVSRVRITRVDKDGNAEVAFIGWDGLDA